MWIPQFNYVLRGISTLCVNVGEARKDQGETNTAAWDLDVVFNSRSQEYVRIVRRLCFQMFRFVWRETKKLWLLMFWCQTGILKNNRKELAPQNVFSSADALFWYDGVIWLHQLKLRAGGEWMLATPNAIEIGCYWIEEKRYENKMPIYFRILGEPHWNSVSSDSWRDQRLLMVWVTLRQNVTMNSGQRNQARWANYWILCCVMNGFSDIWELRLLATMIQTALISLCPSQLTEINIHLIHAK